MAEQIVNGKLFPADEYTPYWIWKGSNMVVGFGISNKYCINILKLHDICQILLMTLNQACSSFLPPSEEKKISFYDEILALHI